MQIDSFALSLIVKATLIFVAGAGVAVLLRNASASVRRSVWALTLAAAASLPIGMLATPAWRLAILPSSPQLTTPTDQPTGAASVGVNQEDGKARVAAPLEASAPATAPVNVISRAGGIELQQAIALLWLAGVTAVLLRMLFGIAGLRAVTKRAVAVSGEAWDSLIRSERDRILPGRQLRVLVSGEVSTPLTFGAMSPVILLPDESATWSAEHRAVVLRHEMAHIATGDTAVCFAAAMACALYWFHPMAWVAAGRLRSEQERACDDRVLEMGTPAADYASHLLEVARSARALGMSGFVSVAMARPSQLEGRLLAVLDEKGPRGTLSRAARITGYAASAILMLGISAVRLEARSAAIVTASSGFVVPGTVSPAPVNEPPLASVAAVSPSAALPESYTPIDSTVTSFVTVSPGGSLVLDLETGASVTITGTDEPIIRMRALLAGRDWRNTAISLTRTRDGARLESHYLRNSNSQSSSHRIELSVPRRYNVTIGSAGGGIVIRDVRGELAGSTGGGDIKIERADGSARITTGGGSVTVTNSNLSGSVGTGGGSVLIQGVTGGLKGSSGTGQVLSGRRGMTYTSSGSGQSGTTDSNGKRYVAKSGGSVSLTTVENGAEISTGGGAISIGTADGHVSANTGGGNISVATLRGSGVLSTGAGDVSVNVSGEGSHSVKVTSGNGKVILTLPPDISATLDIETAYTRNHGPTRIESDWKVPISETRDWDSTEGTPRRYVRARGTIGSGEGRIHVRTVNGDVVIRRSR